MFHRSERSGKKDGLRLFPLRKRPGTKNASASFIFLCHAGRLEAQAAFLAASLRRYLHESAELIAVVPGPAEKWGAPGPAFYRLAQDLRITVREVTNPMRPEIKGSGAANKIYALGVPVKNDFAVLLDSDILCLRPPARPFYAHLRKKQIAAKMVDLLFQFDWKRFYSLLLAEPPSRRHRTTVSGQWSYPYFNAGVVLARSEILESLGKTWLDTFLLITEHISGGSHLLYYRDQISLALSILRRNLAYGLLTEEDNFPLHLRRINPRRTPSLAHYHHAEFLAPYAGLVKELGIYLREFPALREIAAADPEWVELFGGSLEPRPAAPSFKEPAEKGSAHG